MYLKKIIIFIVLCVKIYLFSNTELNTILELKNTKIFNFGFFGSNKLFLFNDNREVQYYSIGKGIYKRFEVIYDIQGNITFYNNNALFLKATSPIGDLCIFNIEKSEILDLSKNFQNRMESNFYFYSNDSILYQFSNRKFNNKIINQEYNIMKFNIKSLKKEILYENSRLIDYTSGNILYYKYNSNDLKNVDVLNPKYNNFNIYLENIDKNKKIKIKKIPFNIDTIKILNDSNLLILNKNSELYYYKIDNQKFFKIKIKKDIIIHNLEYNYNEGLIGILYSDDINSNNLLIFKLLQVKKK